MDEPGRGLPRSSSEHGEAEKDSSQQEYEYENEHEHEPRGEHQVQQQPTQQHRRAEQPHYVSSPFSSSTARNILVRRDVFSVLRLVFLR